MCHWLKKIRKDKSYSQKEISNQSNISRQMYSMIENGQRKPSVSTAKKIAAVLGFDWTLFFTEEHKAG